MDATIEVDSDEEADLIRKGLANAEVRALVKVMGALAPIETDRAKARCLNFVADHFAEQDSLQ